jgi:hypothetical protein
MISFPRCAKSSPKVLRAVAWLCGMTLLLCLAVTQAASQSAPLSLDAYWKQVAETRQVIQNNPTPADILQQAEIWSGIHQIWLPEGEALAVDSSEIVRLLRGNRPDLGHLVHLLEVMEQTRPHLPPYRDGSTELKTLNDILARPEFPRPAEENALTRFWKKVGDLLNRFFESLYATIDQAGGRVPTWVGISLSLALLAAILAYVFRGVWRNSAGEAALADEHLEEVGLTASAAARRAQELSSSGDYRLAVRYLYLSTLLLLDEHGLLRYDRSLTNREYLRQVVQRPDLTEHLRAVIEGFDRTWYGFQPVNEDSYAAYLSHVSALEEIKP